MARFLKQHEAINDKQLRTTVKLLGTLLGNVIKTHAGKDLEYFVWFFKKK